MMRMRRVVSSQQRQVSESLEQKGCAKHERL
jgi:hypothetical protein